MPGTLRCDVLRHAWHDVESPWFRKRDNPGCDCFSLRCERCDKERRDIISLASGDVVSRRYINPPGYVRYPRGERPSMGEFRVLLLSERARAARAALRKEVVAARKSRTRRESIMDVRHAG